MCALMQKLVDQTKVASDEPKVDQDEEKQVSFIQC